MSRFIVAQTKMSQREFNITHNSIFSTTELRDNRAVFYNDKATPEACVYRKQLHITSLLWNFILTQLKVTRIS